MTREFYFPVLDCFMRALPHTYRNIAAKPGSLARNSISKGNVAEAGICFVTVMRGN